MESRRAELVVGRARNGGALGPGAAQHPPQIAAQEPANADNGQAAAQMPNAPEIPERRRRPSLLDRITGLAKS
jgi:hypothetical protein